MISFQCKCGTTVRVDDRFAGRLGRCPKCGDTVRIPGSRSVRGDSGERIPSSQSEATAPAPKQANEHPAAVPGTASSASASNELQDLAAAASHTQRAGAHTDSRISREYAAQLKRNLPVIAVGLAMLVTLFLPWMIIPDGTESTFVMSWDIIGGDQPAGVFVAFLIGSWIIGLTAVIVGFCLSGLPLSILKTGLGLVGIILLLVVATEFLAASRSVPFLPISGRIVLIIMEGIFLLALLIGTHLRLRLGGALWLRILQGAPAGILAILTIISLFTMISDYVRIPNVLRKELTGDMLFFCFLHVGSVAACVLGLVHAAHLKLKSRALVVATPLLIYSVIAMQCLYLLIRPALAESRAAGVVFLVLNAILLVGSISFLLCSGIINSVCDVVKGYGVG